MRIAKVIAVLFALSLGVGVSEASAQSSSAPPRLTPSTPPKGTAIRLRNCGFGHPDAGQTSGQYLVDRDAFYSSTFLPTNIPGGHFEIRGTYPYARWFSFESYDQG